MIKKLVILFIVIVIVVIGMVFFAKSEVNDYLGQEVYAQGDRLVTIKRGSSLRSALWQMEHKGAIETQLLSLPIIALTFHSEFSQYQSGHLSSSGASNFNMYLLKEMVAGNEFQYTVTFIEGSRFSEWRTQLSLAKGLQHKTQEMTESDIAKAVGIDKDKLEGFSI